MLVISAYVGLLGELLGAAFGLTKVFIITAQGLSPGISWMETSVEIAIS
jgi:(hydroxyamino)benzene mutase